VLSRSRRENVEIYTKEFRTRLCFSLAVDLIKGFLIMQIVIVILNFGSSKYAIIVDQ